MVQLKTIRESEVEKFITHRSGGAILHTSRGHVRRLRQDAGRDLRAGPGVHAFISVPQWNALGFWAKAISVNSNQTQQGFGKLLGVCGGSYLKGPKGRPWEVGENVSGTNICL